MSHLLSLAALHEAAPGVLGVVFGPDGDFEGAPRWGGLVWGCEQFGRENDAPTWYDGVSIDADGVVWAESHDEYDRGLTRISDACLDCRLPSVAARLLKLCLEAARCPTDPRLFWDVCDLWEVWSDRSYEAAWTDAHASALATLTLTLAPQIATLGGER